MRISVRLSVSAQVILGFGFARRRTAASCRSARISVSFAPEDRGGNASQDRTIVSSRGTNETRTIADHHLAVAGGQPDSRVGESAQGAMIALGTGDGRIALLASGAGQSR